MRRDKGGTWSARLVPGFILAPLVVPVLFWVVIGSAEATAAVAFLIPWTLRLGAALLLLTLVGAVLVHAGRGEWRPDLLVYASGVILVAVHGATYRVPLRRDLPA